MKFQNEQLLKFKMTDSINKNRIPEYKTELFN